MNNFIEGVIAKAKTAYKTIVLPEGNDERVIKAADFLTREHIANIILLGDENEIKNIFTANSLSFDGITIINPKTSSKLAEYADLFYELRKHKGISKEDALKTAQLSNYFGTLMIKSGDADGMVSGAVYSTADTVRPALQIIKSARKDMDISSFFFMSKDDKTFIFSDCGLIPNPDEQGLANIAIQSAQTAHKFGLTPNIAMLSYSTFGSAKGEMIEKVQNATKKAQELAADAEFSSLNIKVDGELQADAALVPSVTKKKAPASKIQGDAQILVFPDLNAGNIAYKLVQRLGGYDAYGPILQGLKAPINDLSRGCIAEDIVGAVAITAVQAI